jgi:hypothetical protein
MLASRCLNHRKVQGRLERSSKAEVLPGTISANGGRPDETIEATIDVRQIPSFAV